MPDVNLLAVLVSGVAMLVVGGVYYGLLGSGLAPVEPRPGWQVPVVELGRGLVLSTVVAGLASYAGIGTAAGGFVLGLVLWVGFPVVLWSGAVFHERVPVGQALVHAGDWLVKLLVAGTIVTAWQ